MRKTRHFRSIRSIVMEHIDRQAVCSWTKLWRTAGDGKLIPGDLRRISVTLGAQLRAAFEEIQLAVCEGFGATAATACFERGVLEGLRIGHALEGSGISQTQTRWIGASHFCGLGGRHGVEEPEFKGCFWFQGTDNVNPAKLSTDWLEANPNLL